MNKKNHINRPGFGEFANVPNQIHYQSPTEKQLYKKKMEGSLRRFLGQEPGARCLTPQTSSSEEVTSSESESDENQQHLYPDRLMSCRARDINATPVTCPVTLGRWASEATARSQKNWRKLEIGMFKEEVKKILGEPWRIDVDFQGEKWAYGQKTYRSWDLCKGDILFNTGKLKYWSEL